MRTVSFDGDEYRKVLRVLADLCEFKVGNVRPVCNLVSGYRRHCQGGYIFGSVGLLWTDCDEILWRGSV